MFCVHSRCVFQSVGRFGLGGERELLRCSPHQEQTSTCTEAAVRIKSENVLQESRSESQCSTVSFLFSKDEFAHLTCLFQTRRRPVLSHRCTDRTWEWQSGQSGLKHTRLLLKTTPSWATWMIRTRKNRMRSCSRQSSSPLRETHCGW